MGINGASINYDGSPRLTTLEAGAIAYELARRDASISALYVKHNYLGMAVIAELGSPE